MSNILNKNKIIWDTVYNGIIYVLHRILNLILHNEI